MICRNNKIIGVVSLVFVLFARCNSSNYSRIDFQNDSNLFIDSAKIQIQNYSVIFQSVKPHSVKQKKIFKDSVATNNHDITIHAIVYDRNKSNFTGGYYYTDLGGYLKNEYTISVTDSLKIVIR